MALIIIYFKIASLSPLPELLFSSLFFLVILEIALWNSVEKLLINWGYVKKKDIESASYEIKIIKSIHLCVRSFGIPWHTPFHRNSPSQWFSQLFTARFYLKKVWYPREKACENITFSVVEHSEGILLYYISSCLKWNRSIVFLALSVQENRMFPWETYFVRLYSAKPQILGPCRGQDKSFKHHSLHLLHISCPAVGALHETHSRDGVWGKTTF